MDTKTRLKNPMDTPAWQQPVEQTQRFLHQVKKLTRDLHALQTELFQGLADADGSLRQKSILVCPPAADSLLALKTAADQLRRILWFYLEQSFEQNRADALSNTVELELVADARACLTPQRQAEPGPAEPGSFLERLNLVIDGYMQYRGVAANRKSQEP